MKKAILTIVASFILFFVSQAQYWQQKVDYIIDVTLNDIEHTLDGFEKITYTNNSPDTLTYIWFHIWPNAYKNDRTAFSNQLLQNGNTDFYFSNKEQRGYINQLDFKINGVTAKVENHPEHIDIIKLVLPTPLTPSQQIIISTPFHVKLPFNFSRGGYDKQTFQLTQWYPKPAVYDIKGWHPMPYLDQGEFYSEFGNYDVRITLPQEYVVAATGTLQNKEELAWLRTKQLRETSKKSYPPSKTIDKSTSKTPTKKPLNTQPKAEINSGSKTLQFLQTNVHDFALFADKEFVVDWDTCQLQSGKIVDVFTYYRPSQHSVWKSSLIFAKEALRFYSKEVGEYPYTTLSAVQGPESFGGGMEYPTITIISPTTTEKELDITLAHEVGHNWFYGILANNERQYPWMDEGINNFYERKYTKQKYGTSVSQDDILFQTTIKTHKDQSINTSSEDFTALNYSLIAYHKTAEWLKVVEGKIGSSNFKAAMQQYYKQWQFKHPQPEDFKASIATYLTKDTASIFELITTTGKLIKSPSKSFSLITPLQPKSFKTYLKNPSRNALIISPAAGYNVYDKVMIGAVITNYKLPPSSFQFLAIPLYSTGAKMLNGIGKLSYSTYPIKGLQKAEVFINAAKFSMNEFTDSKNEKHVFKFSKIVPGVEITLKEKSLHATTRKSIQWKSFFISEEPLRISIDSLFENGDTTLIDVVNKEQLNFNIHQIKFGIENNRTLYPYDGNFIAQASSDFIRLAIEGNYFFNYKEGGLNVRLFAGKFFYKEDKRYPYGYYFDRFALNLSGPNGEEDYTYSDYFIGRNKFEGLASQQVMIRDGAFKVRTDLLSSKIGKTGNWLAAANFNSYIPKKLNPLSILPFGIPLHIFADIGTYAEAWEPEANTDRFLFDAGIHIPLLKETINLYFPIVYSRAFNEYTKTMYPKNRLFKTMTFSINLRNKDIKKLNQQLGL